RTGVSRVALKKGCRQGGPADAGYHGLCVVIIESLYAYYNSLHDGRPACPPPDGPDMGLDGGTPGRLTACVGQSPPGPRRFTGQIRTRPAPPIRWTRQVAIRTLPRMRRPGRSCTPP